MQAQEYAEAKWSVGQRVRRSQDRDIQAACDRGEILRTHAMRPTWHFLAAADIRWIQRLTAPRVEASNAYRYRQLELDERTLARSLEVIARALGPGEPLTRPELGAELRRSGIAPDGQRLPYFLMHAELECLIASGPRRGKHHTHLLLEGRAPAAPDRTREEDLAELVLRFFRSHGPATLRDFAWWSGLTQADGRTGVAAAGTRLVSRRGEDGTVWIEGAEARATRGAGALLLPTYDEMVVAYQDLRFVPPYAGSFRVPSCSTAGSWAHGSGPWPGARCRWR